MGLEVEHKTSVTHFTDDKRRTASSHGFCHAHELSTYLQIFGEGGNHLKKTLSLITYRALFCRTILVRYIQ